MTIELNDTYFLPDAPQSTAPAFVTSFRTAVVAGIPWSGPRDHVRLPSRVAYSAPPAFARPATGVPISGMAWDTLKENDILPKGRFLTDPTEIGFVLQTSNWSFLVGDTTFLRDAPMDSPPGYGRAFASPVGIAGMAWQTPLDWSNPRLSFTTPPAYAVNVAPVTNTNAGISWFEPPDRDRPATRISIEAPIAYVRPPVVFTPISGIAWQEPLDLITVKPSFSYPPAFGQPIAQPVPISGMAWFEPADRDRPAFKAKVESLPAAFGQVFAPPVPISGIAWFEPPPCTVKLSVSFSDAPALQQPIVQIPSDPPRIGVGGGYSPDRDAIKKALEDWKRRHKKKKHVEVVEEAVEVLEKVESKGILSALAVELEETIVALPANPKPAMIQDIRELTATLERILEDDEEEEIMLMVWAMDR